jgi:hypothetical protein
LSQTLREEHRLRLFENRMLRRIFESQREEVAGGWRRLHNEELHNLYASPNIISLIKSRRIILAGHVARMGKMRMHTVFRFDNLKGRDQLGDLRVDGFWKILEWILRIRLV